MTIRIFIPPNQCGVPTGYIVDWRSLVALLRTFKRNPEAIQFIADMME